MKPTVKRVVELLRADKRYKRLLDTFNTASIYNIPLETLIEEVKRIHSLREIRRLSPRDADFVDKLINANTHDQSSRSRLTEILIQCVHVTLKLTNATDALKQHFLLEYSDQLRQFRTKEERIMVLNIALRKFRTYIDNVENLKALTELVISDIDKGGWSLRNSIQALQATHGHREVQL